MPPTRESRESTRVVDTRPSDELVRRKAAELEAIFESLADGVLIVDGSARIVEANRAMVGLLGCGDKTDLFGPIAQGLHARVMREDGDPVSREDIGVQRALRAAEVVRSTCVVRPEHGGPRWIETIASPIRDTDGSVLAATVVARDMTIHHWRERQHALLDRATDIVLAATDVESTLTGIADLAVGWPAACCAVFLLGDTPGTLRLVTLRGPDRRAAAELDRLFDQRPVRVGEGFAGAVVRAGETLTLPDLSDDILRRHTAGVAESGLVRRLDLGSLVSVPLRGAQGPVGVLVLGWARGSRRLRDQDVHIADELARRAALALEQLRCIGALEEALERLEFVLDSMAAGLLIFGGDGQAVLVNETARVMIDAPSDGIGMTLQHLLASVADRFEDARDIDDVVASVAEQAVATRGSFRLRGQSSVDVEWVATPVQDERGAVLGQVMIWLDVSHLRATERLKDELADDLSEVLRSPLHSISTYAVQALRRSRRAGGDRLVAHGLEVILRHTRQVSMHVNDLVDAARFDPEALVLETVEVDVRDVVQQAIDQTKAITTIHRFRLDLPEAMPRPRWDPDRARQALLHVLSNAVKYWPEGGQITMKVRPRLEGVVISVRDRGLGIPPDEQERVFERFYRMSGQAARRRIRGNGLGLFLVRGIAEAHGGATWIESSGEPGEGTTVFLLLPWDSAAVHSR